MVINEMVYSPNRYKHNECEILATGIYKGYLYWAISMGTHPCCYIEIPKCNKFYNCDYVDIPLECHGGLTYSRNTLTNVETNRKSKRWFIGWDYGHYGDYLGYDEIYGIENHYEKKYSSEDIEHDCLNAIDDLITISNI